MVRPASHAHSNQCPGPLSVRYACGLLWLQAGLWALATLGVALWIMSIVMNGSPIARTHSHTVLFIVAGIGFMLVGALSAGSAYLAAGLARGSAQARIAAVVLESVMVPFGWLFATYTANGEGVNPGPLAGLVGGALSLAAAIGLLSRQARRFTKRDGQTTVPPG